MEPTDELECRNWAELQYQRPLTFIQLEDRHDNFLQTGEFVCLRHPVPLTIKLLDGKHLSLNVTVGRILHVLNDPKRRVPSQA